MPIIILEHTCISRANRLATVLGRYGHKLQHVRVHKGDAVPETLEGVDGVVIMGSPDRLTDGSAAHADAEMALARMAHEAGCPVLGICYGAQILAAALGGEVGELEAGVRVGSHEVRLTPQGREDPVFAGLPWAIDCLHWNRGRGHIAARRCRDVGERACGRSAGVEARRADLCHSVSSGDASRHH